MLTTNIIRKIEPAPHRHSAGPVSVGAARTSARVAHRQHFKAYIARSEGQAHCLACLSAQQGRRNIPKWGGFTSPWPGRRGSFRHRDPPVVRGF